MAVLDLAQALPAEHGGAIDERDALHPGVEGRLQKCPARLEEAGALVALAGITSSRSAKGSVKIINDSDAKDMSSWEGTPPGLEPRLQNQYEYLKINKVMAAAAQEMEARSRIAGHVRSLRKQRGWTQAELADRLNMSQGRLSQIERGGGSFSAEQFLELLKLFNVTADYFEPTRATDDAVLQTPSRASVPRTCARATMSFRASA